MRTKIFTLLFMLSGAYCAFGQQSGAAGGDDWQYGHCLKEVHFGGVQNTNYIPITKDSGMGEYLAPQFVKDHPSGCDNSTGGTIIEQEPVAYVSGTKARVKACFITDCTHSYYIRGLGLTITGNNVETILEFPMQLVTPSGGEVVYKWTDADRVFVQNQVKYFEKFTIKWQMSENGNDWVDIDESENTLYVTYKQPDVQAPLSGYQWFHTLLKVGCEAADEKTTDNTIISTIWSKLKTKNIIAADNGQALFYYKSWECENLTTAALLKGNDGQCGSWASFFIDLLKIQGVSHSTVNGDYLRFNPSGVQADGFFVKDWTASTGVFTGMLDPVFKYVMIPKYPFIVGQTYNTHYSDLIDNTIMIEGQGPNGNPASIFGNHQITIIGGNLLDPSYGVEFSSLDDIESNALFGYYITGDLPNINENLYDFDNDGYPDDLNNNGIIEANATVKVIGVTTDKNVEDLVGTLFNH